MVAQRLSRYLSAEQFGGISKNCTGRLVVPEVYSINPQEGSGSFCKVTFSAEVAPVSIFSSTQSCGRCSNEPCSTSSACLLNFSVDKKIIGELFPVIYWSSVRGNEGASGKAIASRARIDSSETALDISICSCMRVIGSSHLHSRSHSQQGRRLALLG